MQNFVFLPSLLFLLSASFANANDPCTSHGLPQAPVPPKPIGTGYQGSFSENDLVKLINGKPPIKSVSELIPKLPEELRSNFVLMYKTGSFHQADGSVDYLNPRTILFSRDGRTSISFITKPGDPNANSIELLNETSEGKLTAKLIRITGNSKKPVDLTQPKPGAKNDCVKCHGKDTRPIWEAYDLWPGAYGSRHNNFTETEGEQENFDKLYADRMNNGVLKGLIWEDPLKLGSSRSLRENQYTMKDSPNTMLGFAMGAVNKRRIARLVKNSPDYNYLKYYLAAGLLGCKKFPISEEQKAQVKKKTQEEEAIKFAKAGIAPGSAAAKKYYSYEPIYSDNIAEMKYVADLLGESVDFPEWSTSPEQNSLQFYDGVLDHDGAVMLKYDLLSLIMEDIASNDPEVQKNMEYFGGMKCYGYARGETFVLSEVKKSCDYLNKKAEAVDPQSCGTSAGSITKILETAKSQKDHGFEILSDCKQCHDDWNVNDPKLFTSKPLNAGSTEPTLKDEILKRLNNGSMPKTGKKLDQDQLNSVKMYLEQLH